MKNKFAAILSLTGLCCLAVSADTFAIDGVNNSSNSYSIAFKGIKVGVGTMRISKQQQAEGSWKYRLSLNAESTGLAKLVTGEMKISDTTNGLWKDGTWFPNEFNHFEKSDKGNKQHSMYFNWSTNKVNENKDGHVHSYTLQPNTIDYGTTFLVLQSLASQGCISGNYNQLDSGTLKNITIQCVGEETLNGKPVYKYTSSSGEKSFNAYMSRDGDNELQRFVGIKDGNETISLQK
jgi:hypothetical protein